MFGLQVFEANSVLAEIKSLKVKYERLKQESSDSKKEVNKLKEACKKDINRFRKELDTIVDNLESEILVKLDQWKQDKERRVDQNVSTIAAALNVLQVDCKRLEDAKRDGKKEAMFIADTQVSKGFQNYKRKLEDLVTDIETPTLAFERNEILADLVAGIKTLGSLRTQYKSHRQSLKQPEMPLSIKSTKMLIDIKIQPRIDLNIRADDNNNTPWISGCTVMPNVHVVLCDFYNYQIELLNDSWTITGQLQLPYPWDVSVIDSSNVIVASPNKKQLQNVQVFPKMKVGRTLKLDKMCWGVAV